MAARPYSLNLILWPIRRCYIAEFGDLDTLFKALTSSQNLFLLTYFKLEYLNSLHPKKNLTNTFFLLHEGKIMKYVDRNLVSKQVCFARKIIEFHWEIPMPPS